MATKIAITGKSGSGKTTITKAFLKVVQEKFPDKSILLFDNDLTGELGHSFGYDISGLTKIYVDDEEEANKRVRMIINNLFKYINTF